MTPSNPSRVAIKLGNNTEAPRGFKVKAYKVLFALVVPNIAYNMIEEACYFDFANFKEDERRPVGLYAAMAIGSELTQTTLDTFHTAGVLNELVAEGGKRLQELLGNTIGQNRVWLSFPTALRKPGHLVEVTIDKLLANPRAVFDRPAFACWSSLAMQVRSEQPILELQGRTLGKFWIESVGPFEERDGEYGQEVHVGYALDDHAENLEKVAPGKDWQDMWCRRWLVEHYLWGLFKQHVLKGYPEIQAEVVYKDRTRIILKPGALSGPWLTQLPCNHLESNHTGFLVSKYGIEVGRQMILKSLKQILPHVGICHLKLVADVMCWGGGISSISRYSSRKDPDVLKRISFEEARRNLIHACTSGEIDILKSYSSRIVTSKLTETHQDCLEPLSSVMEGVEEF